jgi:hypothetical protein
MWECVILRLLKENGFSEILTFDNVRTRCDREHFLEMRGRGGWHQIDCPCDFAPMIPFINPLRLLGEVKFYSGPIQKNLIREFIGTIKDIQENYFAEDFSKPSYRNTELGVYFSANGFSDESERLAFAHNIKTVSDKNVELLDQLKKLIEEIESNYLSARACLAETNQFVSFFRETLEGKPGASRDFMQRFRPADGFENLTASLADAFSRIRSNFMATTSGGALLHFVSDSEFPDELFESSDSQACRIYRDTEPRRARFYLKFSNHRVSDRRFYFSPPEALERAAFYGSTALVAEKERWMRSLLVTRTIRGITRTLVLNLDQDWLDALHNP